MDGRDLEAARDGIRLLIAEVQLLRFVLEDDSPVTAQRHAMLAKRAATVAGHAGSLASTIARSLPDSVGSVERSAWADGVRGGVSDNIQDREGRAAPFWLIVGGESGPNARPFDVAWARSTIEQCRAAGVSCFVKQVGAHPWDGLGSLWGIDPTMRSGVIRLRDRAGADPAEWPEDLRVQEFPEVAT